MMASRIRGIHSCDMALIIGTLGNSIGCFIIHISTLGDAQSDISTG